jgi:hypothetical protein
MPFWEYMMHSWNDEDEPYTYLHEMSELGAKRWEVVCEMPYTEKELMKLEEDYGDDRGYYRVLMKREMRGDGS